MTVDNQLVILDIWMYKMTNWLSNVNNKSWLNLNNSKVVWDTSTKFSSLNVPVSIQLSLPFATLKMYFPKNYFKLH